MSDLHVNYALGDLGCRPPSNATSVMLSQMISHVMHLALESPYRSWTSQPAAQAWEAKTSYSDEVVMTRSVYIYGPARNAV